MKKTVAGYKISRGKIFVFSLIMIILAMVACSHHAPQERKRYSFTDNYNLPDYDPKKLIEKKSNENIIDTFSDTKITMNFNSAGLADVLKIIAREFKANLVIPKDNKSKVSVSLQNANLYEALEMILTSVDFSYYKKDQLFIILKNTDKVSKVYTLKFVKAIEISEMITGITSTAQIKANEMTNSIVVTDNIVNMATYDEIIENLDRFQPAVMIEADIFEISMENLRNLGIEWGIEYFKNPNEMAAVSPDLLSTGGLLFSYSNLKAPQIQMMLHALRGSSYSELLSKPRIVAMNGVEAKMLVGERVPYVKTSTATSAGNVLQEVEFVDVGILLRVTPRIIEEENLVVIDVQPEVSEVLDKSIQGVPRIGTREAKTRVAVKNGETVIIGGLIKNDKLKAESSTPLLGKIPLINLFFKNRTDNHSEREMIVFITPHILTKEHYDIMKTERKSIQTIQNK